MDDVARCKSKAVWHDPFDLWAHPCLGRVKSCWYQGATWAKLTLHFLYALDWVAPHLMRRAFRTVPHGFVHSLALLQEADSQSCRADFVKAAAKDIHDNAWGLPFAWYSKNGAYPAGIPLVTAAPYVLDALLKVPATNPEYDEAQNLFHSSWHFLDALQVHVDTPTQLALSYAPFDDRTTVINANSYAAWAYAMHAVHGTPQRRAIAADRAKRLSAWVVAQQNADGSWFYLAQRSNWDMIDGFHSCFVVRNLRAATFFLPTLNQTTQAATEKGWQYIQDALFDKNAGLCRRYAASHRADPFRYDIYDQAEYLGLLVDFGLISEAQDLVKRVTSRFFRRGVWHCRIDVFGRVWGREFYRWGIVPFFHHRARLMQHLSESAC